MQDNQIKIMQHIYKLHTHLQNSVLPLGPVAYNKIKIKIESLRSCET